MAKKKVLIVCDSEEESWYIMTRLQLTGEFDPVFFLTTGVKQQIQTAPDAELLVLDCEMFRNDQVQILFDIREKINGIKTLILARQIAISAYRQVAHMSEVATLQKPFDEEFFTAVFTKLASSEPLEQPFPRFQTDEPVPMVVLKNGILVTTRMKNYSAGGAFLEYKGSTLSPGDRLQVNLTANPSEPHHTRNFQLQARVVWTKDTDPNRKSSHGVGIQFLHV